MAYHNQYWPIIEWLTNCKPFQNLFYIVPIVRNDKKDKICKDILVCGQNPYFWVLYQFRRVSQIFKLEGTYCHNRKKNNDFFINPGIFGTKILSMNCSFI